ncbi:hypothetical protein HNQ77_001838 [Silvibacterium bohemicum]|uniref:Uncharacterized protein n=1 Tax=Silvibacterium bohemicum TaxID=1577686 RepID=A0A841JVX0_9BACT|nr:hypothetical protein [Silvibacterium bohemicum]
MSAPFEMFELRHFQYSIGYSTVPNSAAAPNVYAVMHDCN